MNAQELVLLALIGLAAGVFGGMVGLGGGVIMIPAMIYFLGMNQISAQGTSLAVMLPPVGILAVMNYYKSGQINLKYALIIALTFTIAMVKKIFGLALIAIALKMIIKS